MQRNKAPEDGSELNSFALYQVPDSNSVVMYDLPDNTFQTKIYSIRGKEVLSKFITDGSSSIEVDVSSLPIGIYIAKVFSEQGNFQSKFVKK